MAQKKKIFSWTVFGIYFFLLTWLILFKLNLNFADLDHIKTINLIPFKGSLSVNSRFGIKEIVYNIMAFIPLGIYISIFKPDWTTIKKIAPCLYLSILFEILQFTFAIGASDITDVINNTLGGIIGIACYSLFRKLFQNKSVNIINCLGLITELLAVTLLFILLIANK